MSNCFSLIILAVFTSAFLSCQKAPEKNAAGNEGQGNNKVLKTASTYTCDTTVIKVFERGSQQQKRYEIVTSQVGEKSGETTVIDSKTEKGTQETVFTIKEVAQLINSDNSKQKESEINRKVKIKSVWTEEKIENNIYLMTVNRETLSEALDKASYFDGQNGTKIATQKTNNKFETKYFDDGKLSNDILCKKDDEVIECKKSEYIKEVTEDKQNGIIVVKRKLKAPYQEKVGFVESVLEICTYKKQ